MIKFVIARDRKNGDLFEKNLEKKLKFLGIQIFQASTNEDVEEEPICLKYNATIDALLQKNLIDENDIVCFCKEDVNIVDIYFTQKLQTVFDKTDVSVVGVLGSAEISSSVEWWMNKDEVLRGHILYQNGNDETNAHHLVKGSIGFYNDIVAIDKNFMAIRASDLKSVEPRFDEHFEEDFYNIDFCLQMLDAGKKIAVADILLSQRVSYENKSNDPTWKEHQTYFINKWNLKGYSLPITINNFERKDSGVVEIDL